MNRAVWVIFAVAWPALAFGAGEEAVKPDKEGFVPLFNGKELKEWQIKGDAAGFEVKDGIIRSETGRNGQWMYYKKREFSDFVLRVEWRVSERGNSGVFLRVPPEGAPWTTGYEAQISCEQPRRDESHCTGALYGYAAVDPRPDETAEKWRRYEVTCKGPLISVKLDGRKVCELDQNTKEETRAKPLKGFVGVQDSHGPEGTWIEYRSIRIRELAGSGEGEGAEQEGSAKEGEKTEGS